MTTHLPADLEESIRQRIETGRFENEIDVIREAMRLLEREERRNWLIQSLVEGEKGEFTPYTSQLIENLGKEAEENVRAGKPIRDAVKP